MVGEIIVRCGRQTLTCTIGNISVTGMLLYPPRPIGSHPVTARLRLPGETQWLEASAVFVRDAVETGRPHACAIEFLRLPSRTEAALKAFTARRQPHPPFVAALERLYEEAVSVVQASDAQRPLPRLTVAARRR